MSSHTAHPPLTKSQQTLSGERDDWLGDKLPIGISSAIRRHFYGFVK